MYLADALCVRSGVTAIIGGGGKTTLLLALARELSRHQRVIVCTSTRIYPPETIPVVTGGAEEIAAALERHTAVCAARPAENGKLQSPPVCFDELRALCDYVLVEADGAKGLALKAHAPHEPVIPEASNQTICVVGASGFGKPIYKAAHRPALYAEKLGVPVDTIVTPELAAQLLAREALHTRVLVNQADSAALQAQARRFAAALDSEVCVGALKEGWMERC